ncbi:hypothetical protein [Sphingomonas sp. MMS24-J13]|uniref:hypothetical protein n=1 Tax=Sphingomonas sp. MMS24-J13 TaxID=3238686 RepID=UPI00384E95DA
MLRTILVTAVVIATPAKADWQNTRWGSAPAAVEKAIGKKFQAGDPHPASPDDGHTYASSSYSAGTFKFSAFFEFTSAKLSAVQLTLDDGTESCTSLLQSLLSKYGKPVESSTTVPQRKLWRDPARNTVVEIAVYADTYCPVKYKPLHSASLIGL